MRGRVVNAETETIWNQNWLQKSLNYYESDYRLPSIRHGVMNVSLVTQRATEPANCDFFSSAGSTGTGLLSLTSLSIQVSCLHIPSPRMKMANEF